MQKIQGNRAINKKIIVPVIAGAVLYPTPIEAFPYPTPPKPGPSTPPQ